jgi:hypothetical protein
MMKMIHLAAIAALALGLGAGTSLAASAPGTIGNPSGAFAPAPSGSRCDDVQKNPGNYSTVDQDFCSGQTNGDNRGNTSTSNPPHVSNSVRSGPNG